MILAFWADTSRTAGFWTGEGTEAAMAGVGGAGAAAGAVAEAAAEADVDETLLSRGEGACCAVPGLTGTAGGPVMNGR